MSENFESILEEQDELSNLVLQTQNDVDGINRGMEILWEEVEKDIKSDKIDIDKLKGITEGIESRIPLLEESLRDLKFQIGEYSKKMIIKSLEGNNEN